MPIFRIPLCLMVAALLAFTSGCFFKPRKKVSDSYRSAGFSSNYIVEGGTLKRASNPAEAILSFETTVPTFCRFAFFSQDLGDNPSTDQLTPVDCSNKSGDAKTKYAETISGLNATLKYTVRLYVWPSGSSEGAGQSTTIEEGASDSPEPANEPMTSLFVVRLDRPLREAEVHHHTLPAATDAATIKSTLVQKTGCSVGLIDDKSPYRSAEGELQLSKLTTSGFAAGEAKANPHFPQRWRFSYGNLSETVKKWAFSYDQGGKVKSVVATAISQLRNVEMTSTESVTFGEPQLDEAADAIKIDPAKPLKFTWTTGDLSDDAQLLVQIDRSDSNGAIQCIFAAKDLKGEVDSKILQGLSAGKHVVSVELTSNQLWAKNGWLINSVDWRSSRIEK